ncbi:MAG: ArsR family transcriptional regulator [Flavobacteriia bacterium]|nr:ArsR family transcriptional regulator [Flavobacteriia bacterium]
MGAIKPFPYTNFEQSVALGARALNHPCRVKMMHLIWENKGLNSIDLVNYFHLSKSTIHDHVKKLRDAGFVEITYEPHYYSLSIDSKSYEKFILLEEFFGQNPTSTFFRTHVL